MNKELRKMFKDYTFVFDIDGTLCPIKKQDEKYEDLVPFSDMVEKLKYYKQNGAKIVLYTSRNMNSYQGNLGLINKNTAPVLSAWLAKWEIPYDEIVYGKVWPGHKGFYVDDRTVRPDEFLKYTPEELEELCASSRRNTKTGESTNA
jgi:capsule biosynthesis phosphatase